MDSTQTKVTIANGALSKVGMSLITSLTPTTASVEATAVNAIYAQVRDDLLSKHMWTFAQKTVALVVSVTVPVDFGDGATILYNYPTDYIKANFWNLPNALIRLEADGIHSDTTGLYMKYTYANDTPTTYSPEFIQVFICKLAYELSLNFTNSATKRESLGKEYILKLEEAIASDSQLGSPLQARQDEWFSARLSGMGAVPGVGSNNVGFGV